MIARRHEISRLEAFSGAVFGFALALLVVSVGRMLEEQLAGTSPAEVTASP